MSEMGNRKYTTEFKLNAAPLALSSVKSQHTYGVLRLTDDLKDLGEDINHKRIARLKQAHGIYPKQYKKFVVTTDSTHGSAGIHT